MLTVCKDKLSNPHNNCVRTLLNSLVCYDNDYRRTNIKLRNLEQEFKQKVDNAIFQCSEKRKLASASEERLKEFQKNVENIDHITECYKQRIGEIQMMRQSIIDEARQKFEKFHVEKCKLKEFHDKSVEYLKAYAVQSDDPVIVRNCEKDIIEMHKHFIKEVVLIKKSESVLEPFFKILNDCNSKLLYKCCNLQEYEWMPEGKSMKMIDSIVKEIKNTMGNTLIKAFSLLHIHHTADVKSFLASFLMNLERNEEIMEAKLQLFELRK